MEYLVVLDVVQQCMWSGVRHTVHKNRCSRHSDGGIDFDAIEKQLIGQSHFAKPFSKNITAAAPCSHKCKDNGRNNEWEPTAVWQLDDVGSKKRKINDQKSAHQ